MPFSFICDLVFLSLSMISFVSFFVLMPTKSFTSGLFDDLPILPTISRITCCFCYALVLVGGLLHYFYLLLIASPFVYVMNNQLCIIFYLHQGSHRA